MDKADQLWAASKRAKTPREAKRLRRLSIEAAQNAEPRPVKPITGPDMKLVAQLVGDLGFASVKAFRDYVKGKAQPQDDSDALCYTEVRGGYDLNYSSNCLRVYGISANVRGLYQQVRFN